MKALVIGGTGPTGPLIVRGLRARGYRVAILHTGRHERAENPDDLEHIHVDPFSDADLEAGVAGRTFDVCVATYGRLRRVAAILAGRTGRFVSVGGVPAYRGYMHPALWTPAGMPVPTREDAPLVAQPGEDEKGYRIARTEQAVFDAQPDATHFRYPMVYGPYQLLPREWCVVRRVLDGRKRMVLADGGMTLIAHGFVDNLAHAVLLAVDHPEAAAGQIYNCADEETLSVRQMVEIVGAALDHRFEIVSMPWEVAAPARPLVGQPLDTHRVLDLAKLRADLGYRDVVPAREALALTARWLASHPPEPGGFEEIALQDPFDYAAEDELMDAWKRLLERLPLPRREVEPGYGLGYSGPGGRERSEPEFEA